MKKRRSRKYRYVYVDRVTRQFVARGHRRAVRKRIEIKASTRAKLSAAGKKGAAKTNAAKARAKIKARDFGGAVYLGKKKIGFGEHVRDVYDIPFVRVRLKDGQFGFEPSFEAIRSVVEFEAGQKGIASCVMYANVIFKDGNDAWFPTTNRQLVDEPGLPTNFHTQTVVSLNQYDVRTVLELQLQIARS